MKPYVLIAAFISLAGCASEPTVYNRPHTSATQFNMDMGQCKLLALSMPRERPSYLPTSSGGAAAAAGPGATASADGSNPVALNAGIAIGTAIKNNKRETAAFQACMQAKGYRPSKQ